MRGKHFSIIYIPVWVFLLLLSSLLRTTVMSLLESEREVLTDSPHRLYCAWWFVFDGVVVVGGHYRCCSPIPRTMFKCNCGCKVHFFLFCYFDTYWGHISGTLHFTIHQSARIKHKYAIDFRMSTKSGLLTMIVIIITFFFHFISKKGRKTEKSSFDAYVKTDD